MDHLTLDEVAVETGYSVPALRKRMKGGTMPQPVRGSKRGPRGMLFSRDQITAWRAAEFVWNPEDFRRKVELVELASDSMGMVATSTRDDIHPVAKLFAARGKAAVDNVNLALEDRYTVAMTILQTDWPRMLRELLAGSLSAEAQKQMDDLGAAFDSLGKVTRVQAVAKRRAGK